MERQSKESRGLEAHCRGGQGPPRAIAPSGGGSVHRNNILVHKFQQDAHVTEFILSDNCSTCFGLLKIGDGDSRNVLGQLSDKINSVTCVSCWDLYIRKHWELT